MKTWWQIKVLLPYSSCRNRPLSREEISHTEIALKRGRPAKGHGVFWSPWIYFKMSESSLQGAQWYVICTKQFSLIRNWYMITTVSFFKSEFTRRADNSLFLRSVYLFFWSLGIRGDSVWQKRKSFVNQAKGSDIVQINRELYG